jgi:hypothetical protein
MTETIAGRCAGLSVFRSTEQFAFQVSEYTVNFTAIPCDPAKFIKHHFTIWTRGILPESETLNWELKNTTKSQVIASGTGMETVTADYTTYSGNDNIRLRFWVNSGVIPFIGSQIFNHTHYNP